VRRTGEENGYPTIETTGEVFVTLRLRRRT